jgi:hypothetical protein
MFYDEKEGNHGEGNGRDGQSLVQNQNCIRTELSYKESIRTELNQS